MTDIHGGHAEHEHDHEDHGPGFIATVLHITQALGPARAVLFWLILLSEIIGMGYLVYVCRDADPMTDLKLGGATIASLLTIDWLVYKLVVAGRF